MLFFRRTTKKKCTHVQYIASSYATLSKWMGLKERITIFFDVTLLFSSAERSLTAAPLISSTDISVDVGRCTENRPASFPFAITRARHSIYIYPIFARNSKKKKKNFVPRIGSNSRHKLNSTESYFLQNLFDHLSRNIHIHLY